MKKLFATVFAAIMLMALLVSVSAFGLTASVGDVTAKRGDTVTLTVHLSESTIVKGGSVTVSYDTTALDLVGGQWVSVGATGEFDSVSKRGTFSLAEADSIGGSIFSATFKVRNDADFDTFPVSMNLTLKDAEGNNIALTNESGSITVYCKHTGGTATCTAKAICEVCNQPYGDILPHSYVQKLATETYLKSEATCTEEAVYYYSCICGEKGTETFTYGGKLPHIYDRQVTTDTYLKSAATCTAKALYYYSCYCGAKGTETFEHGQLLDHTYDREVASEAYQKSAADCLNAAVYYKSCICGATGTETFTYGSALGHTGGTATCTAKAVCSRCQQSYGEMLPHTYDQEAVSDEYKKSDADCLNAAVYYKSCTCGAVGTETFTAGSALGHTGGTATCTAKAVCTRCNQSYGETLPHTYDQEKVSDQHKKSDADCLNAAVYYKSCSCGANGTETFTVGAALGHTGGTATCTAQAVCTRCNQSYGEILPHTYDQKATTDEYVKSAATCTAKAVYYYSCICGEKGTETFESGDFLPHTYDQQVSTSTYLKSEATCTAKAVYYYSCICGEKGTATYAYGETLAHTYDQQVIADAHEKSAATCTEKAIYYYSCTCGANGTETFTVGSALGHTGGTATCSAQAICTRCNEGYGEMLPHTYDQQVTTDEYKKSAATCTTKAVYYYSCVCGAKGTETFAYGQLLPHTYDQEIVSDKYKMSDADCMNAAVYYKSCTCGAIGTETFAFGAPLGHTGGTATCTARAVCTRCSQSYGAKLPHTYDQQVTTGEYEKSAATCTEQAVYYYSCVCGANSTETFAYGSALGHTGGTATCTAKAVCTRCNQAYGETLPHTYDQEIANDAHKKADADCEHAETYYKSCTCGAVGTETFTVGSALGHIGGTATCTEPAVCDRCDQPYGETLPHISDQEVVSDAHKKSDADCVNAAIYYKSCDCGANGTETFTVGSALGHIEVVTPAVEAACSAAGLTEGKHCGRCGEILVAQKEIPALDHQFGDWSTSKGSTCTEPGEDSRTCSDCGTTETRQTEPADHTWKDATCAEPKTCTECGKTEGKPLDHSFGEWSDTGEAGEQERTCSSCGKTETGNVACCVICGRNNICISIIPLCWLCLLILVLIVLAVIAVVCWFVFKKRKKDAEEAPEEQED